METLEMVTRSTVYSVTFPSYEDYDAAMNDPYELADRAKVGGFEQITLWVEGEKHPRVEGMSVEGILRLGRRCGDLR